MKLFLSNVALNPRTRLCAKFMKGKKANSLENITWLNIPAEKFREKQNLTFNSPLNLSL